MRRQPSSQSGSSTRRSRSMVRRAVARFLIGFTNRSILSGGRPGPVSTIVLTAQGNAASGLGSPSCREGRALRLSPCPYDQSHRHRSSVFCKLLEAEARPDDCV